MTKLKTCSTRLPARSVKIPDFHPDLPSGFDAGDIPLNQDAQKVALAILGGKILN